MIDFFAVYKLKLIIDVHIEKNIKPTLSYKTGFSCKNLKLMN